MNYRILLLVLLSLSGYAQQTQNTLSTKSRKAIELYTEADNFRVRGQYDIAISLLQQAISKDDAFVEAYYRLGLVYMNMRTYAKAIEVFEQGLSLAQDLRRQKVFWYDLGEAYINTGAYDKAMKVLSAYVNNESQNRARLERATQLFRSAEFAFNNKDNTAGYRQRELGDTVNRFPMQYFPVLTADQQQLIYTRRLSPDPNADEDLVVSLKDAQGRWTPPVSISTVINTRTGNEGTCTVSADGRKLIFTSCVGRPGFGSCDLYESRKIGEEWTQPVNLGPNVNSPAWESQPALSADGRTLYFVSDRRAGQGRRDIWVSTLDDKGTWTKARNLGKPINTAYDEISPFIHVNNRTLYYASTGLPGFGGYDIYASEHDSTGWSAPVNFGAPVNNYEDQFSLFITADGRKGYYSHEESFEAQNSRSRIVEIDIPEDKRMVYTSNYVRGIVRDRDTRKPLAARIELISLEKNTTESLISSDSISGNYLMVLTRGAEYALYVNKPGYLFTSLNFSYSVLRNDKPIVIDIDLAPVKVGSVAVLNNIFFDTDRHELKSNSISEIQNIVRFLSDNTKLRIEIGGHTDNVGAEAYNRQLSEKRARAVYQYLVQQGISPSRMAVKGYGQLRPTAPNDTDEGRARNRRIEFTIVN